ncbi:MAG: gas vesicle protein [Chloroflexi bacterium]|nr:gas vesicle protein [Chloroflexota bacterium]
MNPNDVIRKAQDEFASFSRLPINTVVGILKTDVGWLVSLEAVERKAIPDTMDVLGLYEVCLDGEGNVSSFGRKKLRRRGETVDN